MEWFLLWVALSFLAGYVASSKGHNGVVFFFASLILSPLIGFIWALVLKDDSESSNIKSGALKVCPMCAEIVKAEAIKCKHCGADLLKSINQNNENDLNELIRKIKKEN